MDSRLGLIVKYAGKDIHVGFRQVRLEEVAGDEIDPVAHVALCDFDHVGKIEQRCKKTWVSPFRGYRQMTGCFPQIDERA